MNKNLKKLDELTSKLVESCAYDYWITKNMIFLENLQKYLMTIKLKEPFACFAPQWVLSQKEINTTEDKLYLKVLDSTITREIYNIDKEISFEMESYSNSSSAKTILYPSNGSISISLIRGGDYKIVIAGFYKKENITYIDKMGNVTERPGVSYSDLLIRYLKNETNANYGILLHYSFFALLILIGYVLNN